PWDVKTETINKVCASGLRSVTLADQLIRAGDEDVIVAGGMESMSKAPYFLPDARWGNRMGDKAVKDMMVHDGLTCSFQGVHMGSYGNDTAEKYGLTREKQDEWAYRSHMRATKAIEDGKFADEIVPLEIPQRKKDPITVDTDEAPRKDTNRDVLAKLRPAFGADGTITAGNAPGVNDGAGAFVVMSEEKAKADGKTPMATILGHAEVAVPAKEFPETPGLVINKILEKTGYTKEDIALYEVNEAFAVVSLASSEIAGIDPEKVNVDRKSTRLNSSHVSISYAVFCSHGDLHSFPTRRSSDLGHAEVAVPAKEFPETPGLVINKILEKTGYTKEDIALYEVNEAFAVVSLASSEIAGIDPEKVNVNGGAVALGHPIGASG